MEDRSDLLCCQEVAFRGEMDSIRRNDLLDQPCILLECILEDGVKGAEQDFLAVCQGAHLLARFLCIRRGPPVPQTVYPSHVGHC